MNGVAQKAATTVKQTARQTAVSMAKKVASEQLEVLKSAKGQVGMVESASSNEEADFAPTQSQEAPDPAYEQMKAQNDAKSKQLLASLEAEIEKIRQEKKQKELVKMQQEQQEKVQVAQVQEEQKKETMMQKVGKIIKGRISGKREMQKNAGG